MSETRKYHVSVSFEPSKPLANTAKWEVLTSFDTVTVNVSGDITAAEAIGHATSLVTANIYDREVTHISVYKR